MSLHAIVVTTLVTAVSIVVSLGTEEQMFVVPAIALITGMAHEHSRRDRADLQRVQEPMQSPLLAAVPSLTVTLLSPPALPQKAALRANDALGVVTRYVLIVSELP